MNKIISKKAYTLIELIVSLLLASIVFLGIVFINMVLTNNNQDYGQQYIVKSQTQVTLNKILNNASLAVGSGTNDGCGNPDTGILIGTAGLGSGDPVNNPNTFCIHQAANNNMVNSTSDIWLCFTWYQNQGANNSAYSINWCTFPFNNTPPCQTARGAASCSAAAQSTFFGTAYSISNLSAGSTLPQSPYFANSNGQMLFSINIQNCLNNSAVSCNAGTTQGTSSDPANNPEIQITGSAYPLQEGAQQ